MEMNWYTIYTKPQTEKKVVDTLLSKKFQAYCPLNKIGQSWNDKKFKEEPLFRSYVFVKASESQLGELKKINGVMNLVYWLGKPVVVSEAEITLLNRFSNDHLNVSVEKTDISNNENFNSANTAFQHYGEDTSTQNKTAKVFIPSLGFILKAEAEQTNVTVISSENFYRKTMFTSYKLFNKVAEFNTALRASW
ncbi:MAG: UpxY family transcription antiterminator [Ginsengibacter sp.]